MKTLLEMERPRVLVVACNPVGGIRTYFRYIYSAEFCEKWDLTIVAPVGPESSALEAELRDSGIKLIVSGSSKVSVVLKFVKEAMSRRPAIVHAHGLKTAGLIAIPSKVLGAKYIVTLHDVFLENQKTWFYRYLVGLVLSFADTVHSVSYSARDNLIEFLPRVFRSLSHRIISIRNGIDAQCFAGCQASDVKLEVDLSSGPFLVAFLGRFMGQKGFKYLMEAVQILRTDYDIDSSNFRVMAVGSGGYYREEMEEVEARDLSEFFIFIPFMPFVGPFIKTVNVVVMPSLWEACPLLPMETLVCGTPLICTDVIGLSEVVSGTPAIVISPADSRALAEAIFSVLSSPQEKPFLDYVPTAIERFDSSIPSRGMDKLFRKLLGRAEQN